MYQLYQSLYKIHPATTRVSYCWTVVARVALEQIGQIIKHNIRRFVAVGWRFKCRCKNIAGSHLSMLKMSWVTFE